MKKKNNIPGLILLSILIACQLSGQSSHKLLRQGDKSFKSQDYTAAEEAYRKAIEKSSTQKALHNLGNSVYQQERFEEAGQHYMASRDKAKTDMEKANANYNLGNAQLKSGKIDEAINSYKDALKLNPTDEEIKSNLFRAKLMQQQQMQQQQEQKQEEKQEENKEDQNNQNQQQQESSSAEVDPQSGQEERQQDQQQQLSREDAEKLLQVIENEEKKVQEKMRKISGDKKKPKKDW